MSAHCRSCGAEIIWSLTERGRRMPVDAEPVEDGNIYLLPGSLPGQLPTALLRPPNLFTEPNEPRYISHFATCKDAVGWRKGEGK